jgi:CubicO group peptidase (beta-lactamase class C family)
MKFLPPAFVLLAPLLFGQAAAAPDEAALGKGEGYPVCGLPRALTEERCFVGGFSHFDELMPAHRVAKGDRVTRLRDAPDASVGADRYMEANRNTGLLVLQGERILAERYQYGRGPEDRFTSMSMAKTVLAMLFGIALSEASIASLDDTASRYVPELAGTPYGETKLRDLLTMSSGVKFTENYSGRDDIATLSRRAMFHQGPGGAANLQGFTERAAPAGTKFYYASAESEVLGLVLLAALDVPLAEYLSQKIWQPMGAEADATWVVDKAGDELGYVGINARLRDWGRFGLLLASYGSLNGRQVIPEDWVREATHPSAPHLRVGVATRYNGYGYQTWLIDGKDRFAALGLHNQAIFVDPATRLVVVHTGVARAGDTEARGRQFRYFYGLLSRLESR